jgi:hypothetical protein
MGHPKQHIILSAGLSKGRAFPLILLKQLEVANCLQIKAMLMPAS